MRLTCPEGVECPPQLRGHAALGSEPDAQNDVVWVVLPGVFGDGEPFVLRRPVISVTHTDGAPWRGGLLRDRTDYDFRRLLEWLEQELAHEPESEE